MATETNLVLAQIGDEIIELTGTALDEYNKFIADSKALDEKIKAKADAKAAQRQEILSRLGITEEEAHILLGGN